METTSDDPLRWLPVLIMGTLALVIAGFSSPDMALFLVLAAVVWGFICLVARPLSTRLILAVVFAGVPFVLITLATWRPANGPMRQQCINNLRQLTLALMNYETQNGCFPPPYFADADGKPTHSWRVLLLPYLEQQAIYNRYRFDEPWDGPNNRKLHPLIPPVFCCPCGPDGSADPTLMTSYVAVVGKDTAWQPGRSLKLSDFKDGTSNTLAFVEIRQSGIHWMEPRDLYLEQMKLEVNPSEGQGPSSDHLPKLAHVSLFDGTVLWLDSVWSPAELRAVLSPAGGEKVDGNWWLRQR